MSAADAQPYNDSAIIVVSRESDPNGRFRSMTIRCDGEVCAKVGWHETESFEVQAGRHVLRASMDWAASAPLQLEVAAGETVRLTTRLPTNWTESFLAPRACIVLRVAP